MVRVSKQEGVFVFHVISKIKKKLSKTPNTKQKTLLRAVWAEPEETFPFRHPCVVMLRKADIRIMKLM